MPSLLEAFESAAETELPAIEAAIQQTQAKLSALQSLRDGLLRKFGKPALSLFPDPFRVLPGTPEAERSLRDLINRRRPDPSVQPFPLRYEAMSSEATILPWSPAKEEDERFLQGVKEDDHAPKQEAPREAAKEESRTEEEESAEGGEEEATAEPADGDDDRDHAEPPTLVAGDPQPHQPGTGPKFSRPGIPNDLADRRRLVIEVIKTHGPKSVTRLGELTGIGRKGRNCMTAVVGCDLFHVAPDKIVTLTAKGEKAVFV